MTLKISVEHPSFACNREGCGNIVTVQDMELNIGDNVIVKCPNNECNAEYSLLFVYSYVDRIAIASNLEGHIAACNEVVEGHKAQKEQREEATEKLESLPASGGPQ